MGFRLPLDSLPWVARRRRVRTICRAPIRRRRAPAVAGAARTPTPRAPQQSPDRHARSTRRRAGARRVGDRDRPHGAVRRSRATACSTSSCRRSRRSRTISIWSPPSKTTAAALGMRVLLEGYPPPNDPRLRHFLVTPDPGVIEVNIQPARDWDELVEQTTTLYDEAQARAADAPRSSCSTAATPAPAAATTSCSAARPPLDSPFLRRPDLLRSLVVVLAQPSVAVVSVLRAVHRPDQPGAARRRSAPRQPLRARDRVRAAARDRDGAAAAVARRSRVPPPAGRRHRQHAPRRVLHRQALLAGLARRAGAACSSCARSRCRRTRA